MKEARIHADQEDLKKLILLAKEGDQGAFEKVYTMYYTPLFRYIILRIKDKEEAEDMTQTVFMKIWNSIPHWDAGHTSPLAFFFTVARNTMIDHFRKNSHKEIVSDEIVKDLRDKESYSDKDAETRELRDVLMALIDKLTLEQKEIITLFYTNDLSYREIAAITGKREDAIRQIHSRAIKKLRDLYQF
jgi:RNA polymerase sigma-70 factor (ECF subfamily)